MILWEHLRPRGPWLLVKVDPRAEKIGNFYIPDIFLVEYARGQTGVGTVLRVGDGVEKVLGTPVGEGARVIFRDFVKDVSVKNLEPHADGCRVCILNAADLIGLVET